MMQEATEMQMTPEADGVSHSADSGSVEWLSFCVAGQYYAVDILRVREIRTWERATRIPYAAGYVTGLINLRGAIVPVVDFRLRIGMAARAPDAETVLLVLAVRHASGERTIAMVVDAIADVVDSLATYQEAPEFDLMIDSRFVKGLTEASGHLLVLLDIDNLLKIEGDDAMQPVRE